MTFDKQKIKQLLEQKYKQFNTKEFIKNDPIQIPHSFSKKENIEISAFLSAIIAWGNRKIIIRNARKMMKIMQDDPYNFLLSHTYEQIDNLPEFKHRTFNSIDFKYFIKSLKNIYENHGGLENVFTTGYLTDKTIKTALIHFRDVFFSLPSVPQRTYKHIPNVQKGSAAKRLNMFLMWLVRDDKSGVHFGLWKKINKAHLMLPLDVHTGNTARALGLLTRKQNDWKAVMEITKKLRKFDPEDPIKYDFALFGIDIEIKNLKNKITKI